MINKTRFVCLSWTTCGLGGTRLKLEKRRKFIIDFLYFAIVIGVGFCILKYAMPVVAPFLTALFLAYVLRKPIRFLAQKLHLPRKPTAALVVLLFYCTIGVLIALVGIKLFTAVKDMFTGLPVVYKAYIEPFLLNLGNYIERLFFALDAEVIDAIESLLQNFAQSMGDLISGFSVYVISGPVSYTHLILMWRSKMPAFATMVGVAVGLLIIYA